MRRVYDSVMQCVGDTPIVRLNRIPAGLAAKVFAKLEYLNPASSVKDRIALQIVADAEASGLLGPGGTIVEATSGNTGAGLALVAAVKGYKTIFVMPDKQSEEKRAALRAYGAKVVITPTDVQPDDPRSYYKVSRRIADETPNAFYANQYHNPSNPKAHYDMTGPEIWEQMDGQIDVFVACLGTGGTISGIAKYLKEQKPDLKVVGVDPVGSIYYDYFKTGKMTEAFSYVVEGFGEDFLPSTMDFSYIDDVVRVQDKECFVHTRRLAREEGIFCGGSGGAVVAGANKWLKHHDRAGMNVLTLIPDSGSRYLSKIFNDKWMEEQGYLKPSVQLGSVQDVLEGLGRRDVISVNDTVKATEAIGLMKKHGISQLPVLKDGAVHGVVHESRLLEVALSGGKLDTRVSELSGGDFCVVGLDTDVGVVTDLLRKVRIAFVMEGQALVGVVTRIDIIDHVARRTAESEQRESG